MFNDFESTGGAIAALFAIVIGVLLFAYVIAQTVVTARVDSECSRLGYREVNVTWNFDTYCLARTNQTDVVLPLDSARKYPRRGAP